MMSENIPLGTSGVKSSESPSAGGGNRENGRLAAPPWKSWLLTFVCGLLALLGMGAAVQAGCVILGIYPSGKTAGETCWLAAPARPFRSGGRAGDVAETRVELGPEVAGHDALGD